MTDDRSLARFEERVPTQMSEHPVAVYLASLAAGSRRAQQGALDKIARLITGDEDTDAFRFAWWRLRYQHTQALRSQLADMYAPATANRHLAALRGVLKEAWRLELMNAEEYERARDVRTVRGERLPAGREVPIDEIERMLAACTKDESPKGERDGAMIVLLYTGGLRRAELIELAVADYDPAGKMVVRGKGKKQRRISLGLSAREALDRWVDARGPQPGPLFPRIHKSGTVTNLPISGQSVRKILLERAREAGIVNSLSPHDFRRTFVSHLLDAGVDIETVRKMAGHRLVTTTQRYDRRGEAAQEKAAEKITVRFRRKKKR